MKRITKILLFVFIVYVYLLAKEKCSDAGYNVVALSENGFYCLNEGVIEIMENEL